MKHIKVGNEKLPIYHILIDSLGSEKALNSFSEFMQYIV